MSPYYTVLPVDLRDGAALAAAMQRAGLDTRWVWNNMMIYVCREHVLIVLMLWVGDGAPQGAAMQRVGLDARWAGGVRAQNAACCKCTWVR